MILQTDLGIQYTAIEVEKCLKTNKIKHSYSQKGTPYEISAGIGSFHTSLKKKQYTQQVTQILKKQIERYLATLKDFIIENEFTAQLTVSLRRA